MPDEDRVSVCMLSRDKLISFHSTIIRYRTALTELR